MKLVLLSTLAAAIPTSSAFVSTSTTSTIDNRQVVVLFGALHNVEAGVGARNSFGARLVQLLQYVHSICVCVS